MAKNMRAESSKNWQKLWRDGYGGDPKRKPTLLDRKIAKAILSLTVKDHHILEAGSGTGKISSVLARCKRNVCLLDISYEAICFSKTYFKNFGLKGQFKIGDIFKLPYRNNFFDVVWNSGVIEHFSLKEQQKIYQEMVRVCRPSGKIIIIVPNKKGKIYLKAKKEIERKKTWRFGREIPIESLKWLDPDNLLYEEEIAYAEQIGFLSQAKPFLKVPNYLFIAITTIIEKSALGRKILSKTIGSYLLISVFEKTK